MGIVLRRQAGAGRVIAIERIIDHRGLHYGRVLIKKLQPGRRPGNRVVGVRVDATGERRVIPRSAGACHRNGCSVILCAEIGCFQYDNVARNSIVGSNDRDRRIDHGAKAIGQPLSEANGERGKQVGGASGRIGADQHVIGVRYRGGKFVSFLANCNCVARVRV